MEENIIGTLIGILNTVNPSIKTDGITSDTRLRENMGIDSLNMMLLAIAVEDNYGFRFDDMPNFVTVGELVEYIEKRKTVSAVRGEK